MPTSAGAAALSALMLSSSSLANPAPLRERVHALADAIGAQTGAAAGVPLLPAVPFACARVPVGAPPAMPEVLDSSEVLLSLWGGGRARLLAAQGLRARDSRPGAQRDSRPSCTAGCPRRR